MGNNHMTIPYIQAGEDCLGTGWGCDKCYNVDGSCGCAPGTQPWGCGAGQKPHCKSIDGEKLDYTSTVPTTEPTTEPTPAPCKDIVGCIEEGQHCLGCGDGCDRCKKEDGTSACCEGLVPGGCGAGQTPTCVKETTN